MNDNFKRTVGRPKNSLTTVPVKLVDLLGVVNPQAQVPVGRIWLETLGFDVVAASNSASTKDSL